MIFRIFIKKYIDFINKIVSEVTFGLFYCLWSAGTKYLIVFKISAHKLYLRWYFKKCMCGRSTQCRVEDFAKVDK